MQMLWSMRLTQMLSGVVDATVGQFNLDASINELVRSIGIDAAIDCCGDRLFDAAIDAMRRLMRCDAAINAAIDRRSMVFAVIY